MYLQRTIQGFNHFISVIKEKGIKPRFYLYHDTVVIDDLGVTKEVFDESDAFKIDMEIPLGNLQEISEHHAFSMIEQPFIMPSEAGIWRKQFEDEIERLILTCQAERCQLILPRDKLIYAIIYVYHKFIMMPEIVEIEGSPDDCVMKWDYFCSF